MKKLALYCNFFSQAFLKKKIFIFTKYNKISKNFFTFLVKQGYLLRIIIHNNHLQLFLKYNNGIPVFSSLYFFVSKNQKIFLTYEQILKLTNKYPNLFFIFYGNGSFYTITDLKNKKQGGLLVACIN